MVNQKTFRQRAVVADFIKRHGSRIYCIADAMRISDDSTNRFIFYKTQHEQKERLEQRTHLWFQHHDIIYVARVFGRK